jgi:hypothetical protein
MKKLFEIKIRKSEEIYDRTNFRHHEIDWGKMSIIFTDNNLFIVSKTDNSQNIETEFVSNISKVRKEVQNIFEDFNVVINIDDMKLNTKEFVFKFTDYSDGEEFPLDMYITIQIFNENDFDGIKRQIKEIIDI